MKTALKVLLILVLALIIAKLLPLALIPSGVVAGAVLFIGAVALAGVLGLVAGLLGLAVGVFVAAIALLAVLSPIWLPILAIVGLVSLIRRRSARKVAAV